MIVVFVVLRWAEKIGDFFGNGEKSHLEVIFIIIMLLIVLLTDILFLQTPPKSRMRLASLRMTKL